jgi:fructosamine-3-kinase
MPDLLEQIITEELGAAIAHCAPLSGGCIGEVFHLELSDGRGVVAKLDRNKKPRLDIEGYMLRYLEAHSALPVPEIIVSTPQILVMDHIVGDSQFTALSQVHAAKLLADLHKVRGQAHGLEQDTLIGSLHQPNPWTDSWVAFFRDERLLHMAVHARKEGVMPSALLKRIECFAADLGQFIEEPEHPSLLYGDIWTTNVLATNNQISAFIDPAVYYGHPEIELAFITLFSTFGSTFFDAYNTLRPIRPGFFETRRDIYNLYPLLVHARLFGASYLSSVESTLGRLGY